MELSAFKDTCSGAVCILGNGPSLDNVDVARLKHPTIGVNRSWRKVISQWHCLPASSVYFRELATRRWEPRYIVTLGVLKTVKERIDEYTPQGVGTINIDSFVAIPDAFEEEANKLEWSGRVVPALCFTTTGIFAIWFAAYVGFRLIYLLGYDGPTVNGRYLHFKTELPEVGSMAGDHEQHHAEMRKALPPDVRVLNCNPNTRVAEWPPGEVPYQ